MSKNIIKKQHITAKGFPATESFRVVHVIYTQPP